MSFDYFACIEMAIFNLTTLNGTYQIMNGAAQQTGTSSVGFQDNIRVMQIYNDGDQAVTISFDGIINHLYIPSKGTLIVDLQANHDASFLGSGTKQGRKGQLLFGKGTASSVGNLYISGYR